MLEQRFRPRFLCRLGFISSPRRRTVFPFFLSRNNGLFHDKRKQFVVTSRNSNDLGFVLVSLFCPSSRGKKVLFTRVDVPRKTCEKSVTSWLNTSSLKRLFLAVSGTFRRSLLRKSQWFLCTLLLFHNSEMENESSFHCRAIFAGTFLRRACSGKGFLLEFENGKLLDSSLK